MNKKIAIIVDPFSSGALYANLFKKQEIKCVALLSNFPNQDAFRSSIIEKDFDEILKEEDFNFYSLVKYIKSLNPITILPGCELGVFLSEKLINKIIPEFKNTTNLINARVNKWDMYNAISNNNLANIKQIATNNINEALLWIGRTNLINKDLVLKPTQSLRTNGVTKVTKIQDFQNAFYQLISDRNIAGFKNKQVLIQEYTKGPEYIIDSFSYEGIHSIANICKYKKIDNGNFMAVYDNMIWVNHTDSVVNELILYAKSVLNTLGVKFGASHMEIILSNEGPKLVEVGMRPHGGGHANFSRVATGDSQIDRAVNYFSSYGKNTPDNFYKLQINFMIVFLIAKKIATIKNLFILDEIKKLDSFFSSYIQLKEGEIVYPTKDLSNSLDLGFIALCHKNSKQIEQDYKKIRLLEKQIFI
ncbi:ATP-grasp domain-containing protein [Candidatus Hepatincola sp. Av]